MFTIITNCTIFALNGLTNTLPTPQERFLAFGLFCFVLSLLFLLLDELLKNCTLPTCLTTHPSTKSSSKLMRLG